MTWRWYITIAAVRQYMELAGLRGELEDHNPDFVRAQNDLGEHSLTARVVRGKDSASGAIVYRTEGKTTLPNGRKTRLEFTVMPIPRKEGAMPQLLRVTAK
jgi:hypothetical protein